MEIRGSGTLVFDRNVNARSARQLNVDLAGFEYVNLYGLTAIACCLLRAVKTGNRVTFRAPVGMSASNFISRLGFDDFFKDHAGVECELEIAHHQEPRDVLVPFQTIRTSGDLLPLQDMLEQRLARVGSAQSRAALNEALWELGANVTEHSDSPGVVGAVVQRPNRKGEHIDFAIGDGGIGIMGSFLRAKGQHRPESDHEAIELATQYLVSSIDDPGRGQGLHYVIEQVSELNGTVVIRSGTAKRTIVRKSISKKEYGTVAKSESVIPVSGTLVFVSIPCA